MTCQSLSVLRGKTSPNFEIITFCEDLKTYYKSCNWISVSQIALRAWKHFRKFWETGPCSCESIKREIRSITKNCIDHFIILWGPHFLHTAIKPEPKIATVIRKFWTGSGVEYQLSRLRKGFTLMIWIRGWDSYIRNLNLPLPQTSQRSGNNSDM